MKTNKNKKFLLGIFTVFLSIFAYQNSYAQDELLQSGPMVGYSEMKEVALWVQTKQAAKVKIAYWEKNLPQKKSYTSEILTEKNNAFATKLIADEVLPSKKYQYELYINDKVVKRNYPLEFQSQVLWQYRTEPPEFKIAFGSCTYVNDTPYDRPGTPYGGDYDIFTSIAKQKPDLMIWGGDNTYMREADWGTRTGVLYRYTHTRSLPEMQPLLGSTHNYATWDDHDFGPNDSDGSFPNKNITNEIFNLFWANQNSGVSNPDKKGIANTFQWADVQFFMLDDRYFRTANNNKAAKKEMFGKEQLDWLINALAASPATFKIIVSGAQVVNVAQEKENFANFVEEKQYLLDKLKQLDVNGILFVSGDRHHTELSKLSEGFKYPLYDFTISPLTAGVHNYKDEGNTLQVANTLVQQRNFAIFNVSGKRKDRKINVQIFDKNGKELWKKEVTEKELK